MDEFPTVYCQCVCVCVCVCALMEGRVWRGGGLRECERGFGLFEMWLIR